MIFTFGISEAVAGVALLICCWWVGWAALAFALMLGVEFGYIELFDVDETNVEKLGEDNIVGGLPWRWR